MTTGMEARLAGNRRRRQRDRLSRKGLRRWLPTLQPVFAEHATQERILETATARAARRKAKGVPAAKDSPPTWFHPGLEGREWC
jgi:hypothetical protein